MSEEKISSIIEALEELIEDKSVPKNVRLRIQNSITVLQEESDCSIRINKALTELDEVSDDSNMQPYTRTQIWNIVSLLEMI